MASPSAAGSRNDQDGDDGDDSREEDLRVARRDRDDGPDDAGEQGDDGENHRYEDRTDGVGQALDVGLARHGTGDQDLAIRATTVVLRPSTSA